MSYLGLRVVFSLNLRTENPVAIRMNVPELLLFANTSKLVIGYYIRVAGVGLYKTT